eukprot:COSAG01_NODE_3291_length_6306_cov_2.411632_6_plen_394_part_00
MVRSYSASRRRETCLLAFGVHGLLNRPPPYLLGAVELPSCGCVAMSAAAVPPAVEAVKGAAAAAAAVATVASAHHQPQEADAATMAVLDWLAGGASGCVAKTVTAPIERVKLVVQTQAANTQILSGEVRAFSGIGSTFSRIVREQGPAALWRGNLPNCARFFPTQAFNFAFKDAIRRKFPAKPEHGRWGRLAVNVGAGAVAGGGSLVFVYPLDFARTRMAADVGKDGVNREFRGLRHCLSSTVRRSGLISVYQGFVTSLCMFTVYRGLYFGLFDTAKEELQWEHPLSKWAIGAATTAFSSTAVYPLDTVRRRIMMQVGKGSAGDRIHRMDRWFPEPGRSRFSECVREISKQEGIAGFYKGAVSNVLRGMGGAIVLVVYDDMKKLYSQPKARTH